MHEVPIALLVAACGAMFFIGHGLEALFRRWRVPDVLPLIAIGALAGPLLHWITLDPDSTAYHLFSHITLILILFHGGYELRIEEMRAGAWPSARASLVLMLLSGVAVALCGWGLAGLDARIAALLGVAVAPVAATVAIPMLEHLGLDRPLRTAVTLETALGDVVALVGVVSLTAVISGRSAGVGSAAGAFVSSLLVAGALGAGCAFAWSLLLARVQQFGKTAFATEAALLLVAGFASWLGYSDAIAALAFGAVLQNLDALPEGLLRRLRLAPTGLSEIEEKLLAEAVFIAKVFFFLSLGVMLRFAASRLWLAAAAAVVLLALVRLLAYPRLLSRVGDGRQRGIAAWLIPRGLASAVAVTIPVTARIEGSEALRDLVYAIIPLSILLTAAGVSRTGRGMRSG